MTNLFKQFTTDYYMLIDAKLYTPQETANILRCKVGTVYTWKHQKRLIPTGQGKLLFSGMAIKEFLRTNRRK